MRHAALRVGGHSQFEITICDFKLARFVATSDPLRIQSDAPARKVPVRIASHAFLAAKLGPQEVIGMAASGAKYGIMTENC